MYYTVITYYISVYGMSKMFFPLEFYCKALHHWESKIGVFNDFALKPLS